MKIFPGALIAAGLLLYGASAVAEELDLSTWSCKEFEAASKDQVNTIMAWLDGYYKGEDDPPVIDTDQFAANAKKINGYCTLHPDSTLIKATDELFEKE